MVLEGFEQDRQGNHIAKVDSISVTVPEHCDTFIIEQQSGTGPTDCISIWSVTEAEMLIQLLQQWIEATE